MNVFDKENSAKQDLQDAIRVTRTLIEDAMREGYFAEDKINVKAALAAPAVSQSLPQVRQELGDCTRCDLHKTRKQIVFGAGNPNADLMIVGEAPGHDEDIKGEPFVGKAGQLLTDILAAIGLSRQDVYICNVIKCRPPENRNPEDQEIQACQGFLQKQVHAVKPTLILTLGKFASQTLLHSSASISRLRGQMAEFDGYPLMPTFHPAFLLRNPAAKKDVWTDMKKVHQYICQQTGKKLKLKGQ